MWRSLLTLSREPVKALTEAVATHSPTTKNIRRPKVMVREARMNRIRRRNKARTQLIFAKEEHMKTALTASHNARDLLMAQLADHIFSRGHRHVCSVMNTSFVVDGNPATPVVALAGRGKVGKTSLLRSLFRSPSEVGRSNRQLRRNAMNYFSVGDVFNVVDLPGYGGTSVPWSTVLQHAVLLRNFVRVQPSIKMLYYCVDVHHKHGLYIQDIDILKFLAKEVPNFTIVLTKADQLGDSGKAAHLACVRDIQQELLFNDIAHPVLVTSAYHMGGVDALRFDMVMNCLHALPTERLTYAEAKRLSARLLSQAELATVRQFSIPPTPLQDELQRWNSSVQHEAQDQRHLVSVAPFTSAPREVQQAVEDTNSLPEQGCTVRHRASRQRTEGNAESNGNKEEEAAATPPTEVSVESPGESTHALLVNASCAEEAPSVASADADALCFPDPDKQAAYNSLIKKTQNMALMKFVRETSPWRNPLLWPPNVVPTKHPKANIMRCPEDPDNPYLTQSYFVVNRADMYFCRPNVGIRRSSQKGRYEADRPLAFLVKNYTIPYFPDIVDADMYPAPWTFLGSRDAYYERSHGRQLGVRLLRHATAGQLNPLEDSPAPENAALTAELRALEAKRYGAPIAMLRPPEDEEGISVPPAAAPLEPADPMLE